MGLKIVFVERYILRKIWLTIENERKTYLNENRGFVRAGKVFPDNLRNTKEKPWLWKADIQVLLLIGG